MLLVSSTISCRRASNRAVAPEKVNAMRSPSTAKTAPSTAPMPSAAALESSCSRRRPRRRPISRKSSMPMNKLAVNRKTAVPWLMSSPRDCELDAPKAGSVYLARGACRSADACRGTGESERHGGRRTGYHGPRSGHSRSRRRQKALQVRRGITGHDANGKAIVKIDEVSKNVASGRPGATACNIWTTEGFPANNDGAADEGLRKVATTLKNGTIFRVIEFAPGLAARNHRTDSIDYIVVISGEIDMELDDSLVHLKAGDVMVQRGTIHNWVNRGTDPCLLAVVLIDAKSVEAGGKVLPAVG